MRIERVPNRSGNGVTYYLVVATTEAQCDNGLYKLWDTEEIPEYMLLFVLFDWAKREFWERLRDTLEITRPLRQPRIKGPRL